MNNLISIYHDEAEVDDDDDFVIPEASSAAAAFRLRG